MRNWENRVINVLGVEYNLIYSDDCEKYVIFNNCNGFMDSTIKTIVVRSGWPEDDEYNLGNTDDIVKKNTRHEIIHAFLFESGLNVDSKSSSAWATNEEMVDWMAIQFPKMNKLFQELDVI